MDFEDQDWDDLVDMDVDMESKTQHSCYTQEDAAPENPTNIQEYEYKAPLTPPGAYVQEENVQECLPLPREEKKKHVDSGIRDIRIDTMERIKDSFMFGTFDERSIPDRAIYAEIHETQVQNISGFCKPDDIVQSIERMKAGGHVELVRSVRKYYAYFGGDTFQTLSIAELFDMAIAKFPSEIPPMIQELRRSYISALGRLSVCLHDEHIFRDICRMGNELCVLNMLRCTSERIRRLSEVVANLCLARSESMASFCAPNGLYSVEKNVCDNMRNEHAIEKRGIAQAMLIIQDELAKHGYAKMNGGIYKPIYTLYQNKHVFTQAYKRVMNPSNQLEKAILSDLVAALPMHHRVCREWHLTSGWEDKVCERLLRTNTSYFPELKLNDNLRSFNNGIYDMRADIFYTWGDKDLPTDNTATYFKMEYRTFDLMKIQVKNASTDWESEANMNMMRLQCPAFMKLLDYQYPKKTNAATPFNTYSNPKQCVKFLVAMIGRLFFEICEIDPGYERFLAFIGAGGTGKSKIADIVAKIVPNKALIKSQNGEKVFGLGGIRGSKVIIIEEVQADCSVPYDSVLLIGSSNGRKQEIEMIIPAKFKDQIEQLVTQTMLMVGNGWPNSWPNEGKQILRRLIGGLFDRPVTEEDSSILEKMQLQIDAIVTGCVRQYHALIRGVGSRPFKHFIPPEIMADTREITNSSETTRDFLDEGKYVNYDKFGMKSIKIIPYCVLENEFNKATGKKLTTRDFNSIREITKCSFLVLNQGDIKETNKVIAGEMLPAYSDMGYPFLNGVSYKVSESRSIDFDTNLPFVYIMGIELNLAENPRVLLSSRHDPGQPASSSDRRLVVDYMKKKRVSSRCSLCPGSDERERITNFFANVRRSYSYGTFRLGTSTSTLLTHEFVCFKNAFGFEDGCDMLSRYDIDVLRQAQNYVNLDGAITNDCSRIIKPVSDAERFVRMEIYGLVRRVRRRYFQKYMTMPVQKRTQFTNLLKTIELLFSRMRTQMSWPGRD